MTVTISNMHCQGTLANVIARAGLLCCLAIASPVVSSAQEVRFREPNVGRIQTLQAPKTVKEPKTEAAPDRRPYVLILPGVLGKQAWDRNIEAGIKQSRFDGDVEIYDWTKGPLLFGLNIGGDIQQARYLATKIVDFRRQYPHRSIYLLGHSGGCRMIVQTLENLPVEHYVERVILLSAGLESTYDLRIAQSRTNSGVVSFYSPLDIPIAVPLTAAKGIVNGKLDLSAATTGFKPPRYLSSTQRAAYVRQLVQHRYHAEMLKGGHSGGHFGATNPTFVAQYVAPLLGAKSANRDFAGPNRLAQSNGPAP